MKIKLTQPSWAGAWAELGNSPQKHPKLPESKQKSPKVPERTQKLPETHESNQKHIKVSEMWTWSHSKDGIKQSDTQTISL